jgi:serine/threonine protein kinase
LSSCQANCLINNWGVAKISDFGLLKRLVANESGTMECNRFVGTMLYLAPERIAGQSFSFPSDIYAAGLTVIYLATGALQQVPKDYWALVQGANNASAPPPSLPSDGDNATRFSDNLRDFVSRMVAKDPAARWTAAQLLEHPWFQVEEDAATAESASVDPLEQWPGRQLTEPQTEELSILMDAVIQRWYPMPTAESDQPAAEFEPSAYDVSRFTHLAQQLGWDEKAVIAAFVERIQQRNAAALEQLRSSAASSTQVDTSVTDYSSNSSAEPSSICRHSFSSADSSSLSTASSSFSQPHGSLLDSATVESDTVSCLHPPNLPLHSGSPRGLAAGAPRWSGGSSLLLSRSRSNSPCNSPTNASKPPKAPVRPRSPSPAAENNSAAAG